MTQKMLAPGVTLQGRYRVVRALGSGGMGDVYLVEHTQLGGRRFAVKQFVEVNIPAAERAAALADFQREAGILAHLDHPGLARVSDFFNEAGSWYLVMEYVTGESLEEVARRRGGRVPEDEVVDWALQLCDVLGYLHGRNPQVIFRDLKPGNIMLTPEGRIKLIDFGIARFFKPEQTRDTRNLGTPGYAAPEQYGRGQTDVRSDIYSLGVTLHSLLTGYDPALTPFHLPHVRTINASVSQGIEQVIQRAAEAEPSLRFGNAAEFRTALSSASQVAVPAPTPITGTSAAASATAQADQLFGQGVAAFERGDYENAIAIFNRTIALDSQKSEYFGWRAGAHFRKEHWDSAIEDYSHAFQLGLRGGIYYASRAQCFIHKKNYDMALADMDHAIQSEPAKAGEQWWYHWRGWVYHQKEAYDAAIADYNRDLQLNPNRGATYYSRGQSHNYKRNYDRAIADFTRAIELNHDQMDNTFAKISEEKSGRIG